jgi:hypothetical protein
MMDSSRNWKDPIRWKDPVAWREPFDPNGERPAARYLRERDEKNGSVK